MVLVEDTVWSVGGPFRVVVIGRDTVHAIERVRHTRTHGDVVCDFDSHVAWFTRLCKEKKRRQISFDKHMQVLSDHEYGENVC